MSDIDGMERIRLMLAGGRVSGERSYAREQHFYGRRGGPANHVKFEREKQQTKKPKTDRDNKA